MESKISVDVEKLPRVCDILKVLGTRFKIKFKKSTQQIKDEIRKELWPEKY